MTVQQGPVVEFKARPRELTARFNALMSALQQWRDEDHEDATMLTRNDVIEILEGVRTLQGAVAKADSDAC